MEWSSEFYGWRAGDGCPACADGRPDETSWGLRWFAGDVVDAYLAKADVQRGLTIAVFRGRHVAEPTELTDPEAAAFGREVLAVGRAIERVLEPVKLNYQLLGNEVPHLHAHVIPRYADDPRPGWPFPFPDPEPGPMPRERLLADAELLRQSISASRV